MKYLAGYPAELVAGVPALIAKKRLAATVLQRYPEPHGVRTDRALYDYAAALKAEYLRQSVPLAKALFDPKLYVIRNALGTHTAVSRVQGNKLKAKREIRIASLFKEAPAAFLKMIVVHELAHLKERAHDRAFYALCQHMEPDYPQLEFDLRLWLTALELEGQSPSAQGAKAPAS